jgi:hypothetical protein
MRKLFRRNPPIEVPEIVAESVDAPVEAVKVVNPLNGEPLDKDKAGYVLACRAARNNARRALRSGNPARRAEAAVVFVTAPKLIRTLYRQEAAR